MAAKPLAKVRAVRIHLLVGGSENGQDGVFTALSLSTQLPFQVLKSLDVVVQVDGVCALLLLDGSQLGRVHVHRDDDGECSTGGKTDERHVASVKHAHGRDKCDGLWQYRTKLSHSGDRVQNGQRVFRRGHFPMAIVAESIARLSLLAKDCLSSL